MSPPESQAAGKPHSGLQIFGGPSVRLIALVSCGSTSGERLILCLDEWIGRGCPCQTDAWSLCSADDLASPDKGVY